MDSENKQRGSGKLSKRRLIELQERFTSCLAQSTDGLTVETLIGVVLDVLQFDPNASTYTPEKGQREKARRHKLRDGLGISTYISSGGRNHYERSKIKLQNNPPLKAT